MPIDITMPALSPTMETGTLSKWLVKVGDTVKSGDVLAEIETDKATMEVEGIDEGTVLELLTAEGTEGVPVGQVIMRLGGEGEANPPRNGEGDRAAPSGGVVEGQSGESVAPEPAKPAPEAKTEPAATAPPPRPEEGRGPPPRAGEDRVNASPLARRLAQAQGIDLASLKGSGPNGRIVKADLGGAPAPKAELAQVTTLGSVPFREGSRRLLPRSRHPSRRPPRRSIHPRRASLPRRSSSAACARPLRAA